MVAVPNPVAVTLTSDIVPGSNKEFLDIQASIKCRLKILKVMKTTLPNKSGNPEGFKK